MELYGNKTKCSFFSMISCSRIFSSFLENQKVLLGKSLKFYCSLDILEYKIMINFNILEDILIG